MTRKLQLTVNVPVCLSQFYCGYDYRSDCHSRCYWNTICREKWLDRFPENRVVLDKMEKNV